MISAVISAAPDCLSDTHAITIIRQYTDAARDLYEICKKLLDANENTMRWFNKFRYFDFQDAAAGAS